MPTYFFDTFDGVSVVSDPEGRQLPDLSSARREAIEDVKELICTAIFRGDKVWLGELQVRSQSNGDNDFVIRFSDVINGLRS